MTHKAVRRVGVWAHKIQKNGSAGPFFQEEKGRISGLLPRGLGESPYESPLERLLVLVGTAVCYIVKEEEITRLLCDGETAGSWCKNYDTVKTEARGGYQRTLQESGRLFRFF